MSLTSRVVPQELSHKINRGGHMEYDATYKIGKTTVHVVAPPPMTIEEQERVNKGVATAFLNAWRSLPREVQVELNNRYIKEDI